MKKYSRIISIIAMSAIFFTTTIISVPAKAEESSIDASYSQEVWELASYDEWLDDNAALPKGNETVRINADAYILEEGKSLSLSVKVENTGLYGLKIGYSAVTGESLFSSPIELSVNVNGVVPYREAASLTLSRVYESMSDTFEKDEDGNDIQPEQVEATPEREYLLTDGSGYHSDGLYIKLLAGENVITLNSLRSGITLSYIEVGALSKALTYNEYLENNREKVQENDNTETILIEAENIYRKSDCTIVPANDRSSASVTPNSASKMLLNTVGSNFSEVGQWVTWQVDVKKSGYYKLSIYAKQSVNTGAVSSRKLLIDGEVPFCEVENIAFPYSQNYKNYVVSYGGEELLFYFEAGVHEITLQAVLGNMTEYLSRISDVLTALNQDYLDILFYTGSNPDVYREYNFDKLIPQVLKDFSVQSAELKSVSDGIKSLSSASGSNTATLDKLADLVRKMGEDTDEIARNFSQFKDSLSALGAWLNDYTAQPLQIDSLEFIPQGAEYSPKKEKAVSNFIFKFKLFLASFSDEYKDSEADVQKVNVWLSTGRDQSKIIERLSKNDSADTGIYAEIRLVSADALLPNVLSGSKIDVYLNATVADPINYAIRNAVLDLATFDDFDEVASRFHKAAFVPFSYKGAVYALPESFDFPLLFYRKDIFDGLGLSVPATWDEFYETVAVLQKNNLTVGVTWNDMFNLMLTQSGGAYYNEKLTASTLNDYTAITAFSKTLELFTDYGLPVEFSFANRFRSGDMPMGIVPYTMYNQLYLFAPEIDGLWEFTTVPGTVDENGNINNTVIATGTGAVILRTTKNTDAAWQFLKWWTSTDTQINYGIEMEKVMGAAARQSSANLDVVKGFPWSAEEYGVISTQWNNLDAIPQIPGSYYINRTLDFAFNSVYSSGEDASGELLDNVSELNEEITRKISEFEKD